MGESYKSVIEVPCPLSGSEIIRFNLTQKRVHIMEPMDPGPFGSITGPFGSIMGQSRIGHWLVIVMHSPT